MAPRKKKPPIETDETSDEDDFLEDAHGRTWKQSGDGCGVLDEDNIVGEKLAQHAKTFDNSKINRTLGELPPFKRRASWAEFCDYCKDLNTEQRNNITIYKYRVWPVVDMTRVTDGIKSIDVQTANPEIVSHEYLETVHGGGKYNIRVNNAQTGQNLTTINEEIPWTQFEPIIDLTTLVLTEPKNQPYINWLKAKGKLDSDGNIINPQKDYKRMEQETLSVLVGKMLDQKNNSNSNSEPMMMMMQMLMNQNKQSNDMLMAIMNQKKESSSDSSIVTLQQQIMTMTNDFQRQSLEQAKQHAQQNLEMQAQILKLQNEKPANASNPMDMFKMFKDMMQVVQGVQDIAAPASTSITDKLLNMASEVAPALLTTFIQSQQPQQQSSNVVVPNLNPTPSETPSMITQPNQPTVVDTFVDLAYNPSVYMFIKGVLANDKLSGADLANQLCDSNKQYEMLLQQLSIVGTPQIVPAMMAHPKWAEMYGVFGEEKVTKFIEQCLSIFDVVEEKDEEEKKEVVEVKKEVN